MSYCYKKLKVKGVCIDAHRHIMQEHLGRKLERLEVVHHKDGNKLNNDLSNLEVMSARDHARHHLKGIKLSPELVAKCRRSGLATRFKFSKLTVESVGQIKLRLSRGEKLQDIADLFDVSWKIIYNISRNYRWKDIPTAVELAEVAA